MAPTHALPALLDHSLCGSPLLQGTVGDAPPLSQSSLARKTAAQMGAAGVVMIVGHQHAQLVMSPGVSLLHLAASQRMPEMARTQASFAD